MLGVEGRGADSSSTLEREEEVKASALLRVSLTDHMSPRGNTCQHALVPGSGRPVSGVMATKSV